MFIATLVAKDRLSAGDISAAMDRLVAASPLVGEGRGEGMRPCIALPLIPTFSHKGRRRKTLKSNQAK
jgi:hypothetical protein